MARLRVPLGWLGGLCALFLARPTPALWIAGTALSALGQAIRLWAAGHLEKWNELARSGPYAWTRNPLYLGSVLMGSGLALATARWEVGLLWGVLLVAVYLPVIRAEAAELGQRYPDTYPGYAKRVPLFLPKPPGERAPADRRFSWDRVLRNREHVTVAGWLAGVLLLWWAMRARGG